jgi:hypothetical protein
MGIASSLKKLSNKTIIKFGGDITIKTTTQSAYNSADGSVVKQQTSVTVKGVIESVTVRETNDLISQDDIKLLLSAGAIDFVPTTKDKILISGITYNIIKIDKETIENQDVVYTFYLRA